MTKYFAKITQRIQVFFNRMDSDSRKKFLFILVILSILPLLLVTLKQVQNLRQQAGPNGTLSIVVDGKEIENSGFITQTYVKLKMTQPDDWQITSLSPRTYANKTQASFVKQASAQAACPTTPGQPGLTTTYGTITYDSCVDNTGGKNSDGTLCTSNSATRFRCYFWQNPTGCISGANENDFNYYCPAKPTATPIPAQNTPVPCPQSGQTGTKDTFGTITYDRCVDNAGGKSENNTLCQNQSATKFRCYFSGNSACISGKDTNDYNYYCPAKPSASPNPSTPPATNTPVPPTVTPTNTPIPPTGSPTNPPVRNLLKVTIENVDGGSQGSPKQEYDNQNEVGRKAIRQLLEGTFDWQLNPYAANDARKVKITFVDQSQAAVSTDIVVTLKASVKILNKDDSIPQNNIVRDPNVKLVINGTALLAKQNNTLVKKAYAAPEDVLCIGTGGRRALCKAGTVCVLTNGDPSCVPPSPTPLPPTATPTPTSQPRNCQNPPGKTNDTYNTCISTGPTNKCPNNVQREAILYMCDKNGVWQRYGSDCINADICSNIPTSTPTRIPSRPGNPAPTNPPANPPSNTCPQSGDTCSYSEVGDDGQVHCFSGKGTSGFNQEGCSYSCGPIACEGGDEPPIAAPPVEPPSNSGGDQPGTPSQPMIIVRNADSGNGGSAEKILPLTTGDITIDDWKLNDTASNSLRTVQVIFQNTNGEMITVVNAFVHLKSSAEEPTPAVLQTPALLNDTSRAEAWNIFLKCYSDFAPARNCTEDEKKLVDLNKDGKVNAEDITLFLKRLNEPTPIPPTQ